MYISKETSAGLGSMYLYNHKDILVIYQLLGSYPLPQQASHCSHFITGAQHTSIIKRRETWALVWTSVMNPSEGFLQKEYYFLQRFFRILLQSVCVFSQVIT